MTKEEIIEKLKKIMINNLNHEDFEITDTLTAGDVKGWDSLSHMVIITDVEDTFKVRFKLKELNQLKNMGSLIEFIQLKMTN